MVEVVADGPTEFKVLHVFVGVIAHVGDQCGPGIAEYRDNLRFAPVAKPGQHGIFVVERDENAHLQCTELYHHWLGNALLDDARHYQQFKELAEDFEAYAHLPADNRPDALRKYANSQTNGVARWAIFTFSHAFPDAFTSYARDIIEHDRFTFQQQVQFVKALREDDASWPLRLQMMSKWGKANPSREDAAAMISCIWDETVPIPPNGKVLLLPTCIDAELNRAFPIQQRIQIVEALGENARRAQSSDWTDAIEKILASSDEPELRHAATAALAHAQHRPDTAPATHGIQKPEIQF